MIVVDGNSQQLETQNAKQIQIQGASYPLRLLYIHPLMSRNPHIVTRSATQHAAQAAHLSQPQGTLAQDDQPMADEAQEGYGICPSFVHLGIISDIIFNRLLASSTPTSSLTWIAWFCSLPGHEYFCEVTEDFIEDDFNLTGLSAMVPFWKEAMEMVLDVEPGTQRRC